MKGHVKKTSKKIVRTSNASACVKSKKITVRDADIVHTAVERAVNEYGGALRKLADR